MQALNRPTFNIPPREDYAIIVSLVLDQGTISLRDNLLAFDLSVFRNGKPDPFRQFRSMGNTTVSDDFIHQLSEIIRTIKGVYPEPTAQVYTWSSQEVAAINELIVYKALSATEVSEDIRQCIETLVDLPSLLQIDVQPSLFGDSTSQTFKRQKEERSLEQRVSELKVGEPNQPKLRKLPSIVALHQAARDVIAIPGPGYTTLEIWASTLGIQPSVPSTADLYVLARDQRPDLSKQLASQSLLVYKILCALRQLIGEDAPRVFVNLALPLRSQYTPACQNETLRKLVFMHEVFRNRFSVS